jgi:hypothetical protein
VVTCCIKKSWLETFAVAVGNAETESKDFSCAKIVWSPLLGLAIPVNIARSDWFSAIFLYRSIV